MLSDGFCDSNLAKTQDMHTKNVAGRDPSIMPEQ